MQNDKNPIVKKKKKTRLKIHVINAHNQENLRMLLSLIHQSHNAHVFILIEISDLKNQEKSQLHAYFGTLPQQRSQNHC